MIRHPPAERRVDARAEVAASAVVLAGNRNAGTFLVENLSAGGALLVGDPLVCIGQRVKLLLSLVTRPVLSLMAEVIRRGERSSGEMTFVIEFRNVPASGQDRIQRTVLAALERRNIAERAPDLRREVESPPT